MFFVKRLLRFFKSQKQPSHIIPVKEPVNLPSNEIDPNSFFNPNKSSSIIQERMKFFAHAQMKDLAEVGEKKALGYLPLETIRNAGFDAFHVSRFLQKNGLTVFIIPAPLPEEIYAYDSTIEKFVHVQTKQTFEVIPRGNFLTIKSGALVAFDKKAIDAFLQEKKEFIYHENQQETNEDYKWPSEANAFVNMLFRKQASSSLMNHFIHCIYTSMPTAITSNVNRPEC